MSRSLRLGFALAAIAAIFVIPTLATAEGPTAQTSRSCDPRNIEQAQSYPPASYVQTIRTNISCRKAKSVIRAYHRCRGRHGGRNGRCPNRVQRFRCREGARQAVPGVQYNAKVTCRRGGRRIVSRYTQNV